MLTSRMIWARQVGTVLLQRASEYQLAARQGVLKRTHQSSAGCLNAASSNHWAPLRAASYVSSLLALQLGQTNLLLGKSCRGALGLMTSPRFTLCTHRMQAIQRLDFARTFHLYVHLLPCSSATLDCKHCSQCNKHETLPTGTSWVRARTKIRRRHRSQKTTPGVCSELHAVRGTQWQYRAPLPLAPSTGRNSHGFLPSVCKAACPGCAAKLTVLGSMQTHQRSRPRTALRATLCHWHQQLC